jgi:hypothetical protein
VRSVSKSYNSRSNVKYPLLNGARVCAYANQAQSAEGLVATGCYRLFSNLKLVLWAIALTATTTAPIDLVHADDCLAAPNSAVPRGSHWYYHLNHTTQQKCWYVRSIEKQPRDVSIPTTPTTADVPSRHVGQIGSAGRDIDSELSQPYTVVAAAEESVLGAVQSTQGDAAAPEAPSSDSSVGPAVPTVVWPDPPPIRPSMKANDAEGATALRDPVYSVALTSDDLSRGDERTSTHNVPITLFPVVAFGLVVLAFGFRFLTKHAAARRAQQDDDTRAITTLSNDLAKPVGNGLADEAANGAEDDFESFVSASTGLGPLDRIIRSSANDVGAREARLAQLREEIGQRLGWAKPVQQHSAGLRVAS